MHVFLGLRLDKSAAIATIVNGLMVLVLVIINVLYLRSANKQAKAALAQADAATESLKDSEGEINL